MATRTKPYIHRIFSTKVILSIGTVLFLLIPAVTRMIDSELGIASSFLSIFHNLLVLSLILAVFLIFKRMTRKTFVLNGIALVAALYYFVIYFLIFFRSYTGNDFDLFFVFDSLKEAVPTAVKSLGPITFAFIISSVLLMGGMFFLLFQSFLYLLEKFKRFFDYGNLLPLFIILLLNIWIIPPELGYFTSQFSSVAKIGAARKIIKPIFPDNGSYQTKSHENIFILQLESVNAIAVNGDATVGEHKYSDNYIPKLSSLSKYGIFFPYFLGNSIQTNRAQETFLCGTVNNIGIAFSFNTQKILTRCLPRILKRSGYQTIAFRSDTLGFANEGQFMKNIGFDEIHYSDIMMPSDRRYKWGYDDCLFYKRAFDYLSRRYKDKKNLFVYVEVSSTHFPFAPKDEYAYLHKFNPSNNFAEAYLNSMLEQDYCVGRFFKSFQSYDSGNSHLFIFSDHSWPIGIHGNIFNERGSFNENFMIPFLYIPPENRKHEFKLGSMVDNFYGQTDIIPTIFDLLNNRSYQNSFAFELKKHARTKNYERCHILTQPYGGGEIAVVQGDNKYVYSIFKKQLIHYSLKKDFYEKSPKILSENLSYGSFKEKYYCKRYNKR